MSLLNYIFIVILSLFTTIIFVSSILYSDRKSREPVYMILICLVSGIFTIGLSILLGEVILPNLQIVSSGLFSYNTNSVIRILILALVEEYSKLLVLYLFISRNSNFDDIYDGFVYSSLIALSFSALETLMYVFNEGSFSSMAQLAILRSVTTIPLHLICGITMGYYMGLEKFSWGTKRRMFNLAKCLLIPTIIHFCYNYLLTNIMTYLYNDGMVIIFLLTFFIPFCILAIFYIKKAIFLNNKFINNEKYKNLMTLDEYIEITKYDRV